MSIQAALEMLRSSVQSAYLPFSLWIQKLLKASELMGQEVASRGLIRRC